MTPWAFRGSTGSIWLMYFTIHPLFGGSRGPREGPFDRGAGAARRAIVVQQQPRPVGLHRVGMKLEGQLARIHLPAQLAEALRGFDFRGNRVNRRSPDIGDAVTDGAGLRVDVR